MNANNESQDAGEDKPRLSRPDIFTRVAGSHLTRRDMVKASVVAGGLVWSAPTLLSSSKASAQTGCCPTGTTSVTLRVDPPPGLLGLGAGTLSCGPITCLTSTACDPMIEECLDNFVQPFVSLDALGLARVVTLTLSGGVTVAAIGVVTGTNPCVSSEPNCTLANLNLAVGPVTVEVQALNLIVVTVLLDTLDHIELELCVPGTATGLCA